MRAHPVPGRPWGSGAAGLHREPSFAILVSMTDAPTPRLQNPPIVEAVVNVDCDLPPGFDLATLEGPARARFGDRYPKFSAQVVPLATVQANLGTLQDISFRSALQALQFRQEDEKQLVQIRPQGFSFNRLAPYSSLDDYLPEIERTWRLYVDLVAPVQMRAIRLRYINRIVLPMAANTIDLDEFLKIGRGFPDQDKLVFSGLFIQQTAIEKDTGAEVNLVLRGQTPKVETLAVNPKVETLEVILDITVAAAVRSEETDWANMQPVVASLRRLKNRIFAGTLTIKCMELFQS